MTVGFAVTANIPSGTALIGVGTTSASNAILKGVIVGVNTNSTDGSKSSIDVRVTERIIAVGGGTTFQEISYAEKIQPEHLL